MIEKLEGDLLLQEFLIPLEITQKQFALHVGWTYARLNELVHGKRGVTADTALTLGEAFNMEPEFWLNLQKNWDLWQAARHHHAVRPII
ncbi:MAG: addiction module antidote protein, HigA family [Gammaproteobacteria bacterium RIFCSPHIGHO2_12_FULL_45_9]|nr:MAG: addiction module antidote protein, HigA family [Gammaproteobacteria bacterium RIFCSPHIGHO2_12_FULL_45_9]